jgi:phosphotriesterase-related protein
MMANVMTVTGAIDAAVLGPTLMHEHVSCDITPVAARTDPPTALRVTLQDRFALDRTPAAPGVYRLKDEAAAIADLRAFHAAGGRSVVDLTTGGIAPDPAALARISAASGVNIILGAGWYYDAYVPEAARKMDVAALTEQMVAQLTEGAWGTSIRCGLIGEVGTSWPMTPFEQRSLQAAAMAQRATGAAINIHPAWHPDAADAVCDILDRAGADLSRVVMSHMDRSYPDDVDAVIALARRCIVEYDFFGVESSAWIRHVDMPNDWMRLRALRRIFDAGLDHRVCISHDICTVPRLLANGGHGYRHILHDVVPLMRDRGWAQDEIDQILVRTPRRLLAR